MTVPVRLALTILFATTIAACGIPAKRVEPAVSTGTSLQIKQSFENLPNGSKIYFQSGNALKIGQVDRWSPYCELYVINKNQQADYHTSVSPGRFEVTGSKFNEEYVDNQNFESFESIQLASRLWDGDGPPSYILYSSILHLWSSQQPDVKTLTCSQKASTYGDYHLTLSQIQQALGPSIELNL